LRPEIVFWREWAGGTPYGGYRPLSAGFLGLILFRIFYEPRSPSKRRDIVDGVFIGFLAVLVMFVKVTYIIMGSLPVFTAFVLFPATRRLILAAGATALLLLAALEWGGHHYVTGYARDILVAIKIHSRQGLRDFIPYYAKSRGGVAFILLVALALFVAWRAGNPGAWRVQILLLSCLASGFLINEYDSNWPNVTAYLPVFLVIGQMLKKPGNPSGKWPARLPRYIYQTLIVLFILARLDVSCVGLFASASDAVAAEPAVAAQWIPVDPARRPMNFPRLSAFLPYYEKCKKELLELDPCHDRFVEDDHIKKGGDVISLAQYTQSGAELLGNERRHEDVHDLLVLDFVNPFDSLLGVAPARALPLWFDPTTLSRACHPAPDVFFSRAAYVLEPLYPILALYVKDMEDFYGDYLKKNFIAIGRNDRFVLWKRMRPAKVETLRYDCQSSP
jgi:hypothetical protein